MSNRSKPGRILLLILAFSLVSSFAWYTGHVQGAGPAINWNLGAGSMIQLSRYIVYSDGVTWFTRDGQTGNPTIDSSAGDSPVTDPVPMINRDLALLGGGDSFAVVGNYTTTRTVTISKSFGGYYHYGWILENGNVPAITVNDPHSGYDDYTNTGMQINIRGIQGSAGSTGAVFLSASAGIRCQNMMQHTITVGEIMGFQYGILVDQTTLDGPTTRAICNDNDFHVRTLTNNNYAVRFLGPPGGTANNVQTGCQGNNWFLQIIYPNNGAYGIVKDTGLLHQYNQWFYISLVTVGGASGFFINNPGATAGGIANTGGDYILSLYWVNNGNNILQPDDVLIVQNPKQDAAGPYGSVTHAVKFGLSQKQLGVSFTSATSKAVTFPIVEYDTSYSVVVTFNQNSGNYWITSKSTTGCTINWSTSSTGSLDYFLYR